MNLIAFIALMGTAFLAIGCGTSSWIVWEAGTSSKDTEWGTMGSFHFCLNLEPEEEGSQFVCDIADEKIQQLSLAGVEDVEIKFKVVQGFSIMAALMSFLGFASVLAQAHGWHDQKWFTVGLLGWGAVCGMIVVIVYALFRTDFYDHSKSGGTVTYVGLGFSFFLEMVGAIQILIASCVTQLKKTDDIY